MKKLILGVVLMVAMTLSLTSGCIDKGQLEEGITVPIEVPVDIPIETEINVTIRETIIRVTPTPEPTPTPRPTATPTLVPTPTATPVPIPMTIDYPVTAHFDVDYIEDGYEITGYIKMHLYSDRTSTGEARFYVDGILDEEEEHWDTWEIYEHSSSKIVHCIEGYILVTLYKNSTATFSEDGYPAVDDYTGYWTPLAISTPTPTPIATPTPYPTATPIPEMSEDEKLITRYLEMHEFFLVGVCMEYHNGTCISAKTVPLEEAVGYWMEFITLNDLQPVEIYRQSLILYEPSYGYLWAWTYETQYLRKYDYNEEYSYPPLCWEAKNKYNAESIALAGEIRTCSTHAYHPQLYAFGDIEDTRGCIKAQFS